MFLTTTTQLRIRKKALNMSERDHNTEEYRKRIIKQKHHI